MLYEVITLRGGREPPETVQQLQLELVSLQDFSRGGQLPVEVQPGPRFRDKVVREERRDPEVEFGLLLLAGIV